ncbi:unnamed protein product [Bursaphelenchus xylophilus]|uniref:(pine wood nematode) hypothetical protein n=1 Tax=Bursaphelenchus xylophilus TaxID=6326 RepID=A0A7I8WW48_BURXY|nr:unnamed protein product [Bursaphelenchus xylophilus]CAG9117978.1 unnamed protein product [Bursaphelenchus xylophilus]
MEADLFRLLFADHLQDAIFKKDTENLVNFARFLAAFFADLPIVCPEDREIKEFPSLWRLAEYEESDYDKSKYKKLQSDYVSANIPPTYSPALPVQLLCYTGHLTEACLYIDHFNDLRSQLILRVLADGQYGLNLTQQHIHQIFIHDFIDTLTFEQIQDDQIKLMVEVFTKLSTLFDLSWLYSLIEGLLDRLSDISDGLPDDVDASVMLPRPPVFMLPGQETGEIPELIQWSVIYKLIRSFLHILQRANWLKSLSGGLLKRIWKVNPHFTATMTNDDFEDELGENLHESMESIVKETLRLSYRDQAAILRRRGATEPELAQIYEKSQKIRDDSEWMSYLDSDDIDEIMKTLRLFDDIIEEKEWYLPPLSESTVEQWKAAMFTEVKVASARRSSNELNVLEEENKIEIAQKDFLVLDYIANTLPFISLPDSSLIGITLKLKPSDICKVKPQSFYPQSTPRNPSTVVEKEPARRPLQASLGDRIRQSLRRLGGKPATGIPMDNIDDIAKNLEDSEIEKQLIEEREYLSNIKKDPEILQAYRSRVISDFRPRVIPNFEKLRKLKLAKSPGLKRKTVSKNFDENVNDDFNLEGNLSDELKAISARLSHLKTKWSGTPEEIMKYADSGISYNHRSTSDVKPIIRTSKSMGFSNPSTSKIDLLEDIVMDKMNYEQYAKFKPSTSKSMDFYSSKKTHKPETPWKFDDLSSGISSSSISPDLSDRKKVYKTRKFLEKEHNKVLERQNKDRRDQKASESDDDSGLKSSKDTKKLSDLDRPPIDHGEYKPEEQLRYELNYTNEYYEDAPQALDMILDKEELVPEEIPEPDTPSSIGKLDLSLLSDRQEEKAKKKGTNDWTEVKVYDRSPKKSAKPRQPQMVLPDWLRLLPYEEKATSSRLLSLTAEKDSKSRSSRTGRKSKSPYLNIKEAIRDSGYLDQTSRSSKKQQTVIPLQTMIHDDNVFDMTEEQVNKLIMNS